MLAGAAAYAHFLIDRRSHAGFSLYHMDGAYGAFGGAFPAMGFAGCTDAGLEVYVCGSNVILSLFLPCYFLNGSGRANLTAAGAFRAAEAVLITHLRLHEALRVR